MNSIVRFFALSLFVALAISAATGTFSNYTTNNSSGATAAAYTNGYVVLIAGAGWVIGDTLALTTTATNTWATLTASTGTTGIGLIATGCSSYTTSTASLVGLAVTANAACPGDFATVYTVAPTSPTSTTIAPLAPASPNLVAVGGTIKFTLTTIASPANNKVIGIDVTVGSATLVSPSVVNTAPGTAGGAAQYALSNLNYAFYVQTSTAAQVCFQNDSQKTSNAGNCGSLVTSTKSANIFSAAITGFVAMIALIFFN